MLHLQQVNSISIVKVKESFRKIFNKKKGGGGMAKGLCFWQRRKTSNKKGFTLAELLVGIGILSILFSIGAIGVVAYQKRLKLTEMDGIARQIFISAQNNLTIAKETGAWEEVETKRKEMAGASDIDAYFGQVMEQPSDYTESWPTGAKNAEHEYRYIVYNGNSDTQSNTILSVLLPFASIEEGVRSDGQYIIEYDYKTATVYGVFYTNSEETISYTADIVGANGLNARGGRGQDEAGRQIRRNYKNASGKNIVIGYYGGAIAQNLTPETLSKPQVQVNNGNKLQLTITDENYNRVVGTSPNVMKIQSKIRLTLLGEDSGNKAVRLLSYNNSSLFSSLGDSWWSVKEEGGKVVYQVTLDDITTQGGQFATLFPELWAGENVVISVEVFSNQVLSTPASTKARVNSLFGAKYTDKTGSESTNQITIGNIRHLQNLSPDISNLFGNKSDAIMSTWTNLKVEQTETLNWFDFTNDVGSNPKIYGYHKNKNAQPTLADNQFYSIDNQWIITYEGNNHTIKNFSITNDKSGHAGIFSSIGGIAKHMVIKDINLDSITTINKSTNDSVHTGTLIGGVYWTLSLTVENITAVNSSVSVDKGDAGSLIGYVESGTNGVTLRNLTSMNPTVTMYSGNAGGLIGFMSTGTVENCGVYFTDTTTNLDGSQISYPAWKKYEEGAYNMKDKTIGGVSIDDTERMNIKYQVYSRYGLAGGFIGQVDGTTIKDCFTAIPVVTKNGVAGGFIAKTASYGDGYKNINISNSYVGGYTKDGEYSKYQNVTSTNGTAGGFIGELSSTATTTIENCYSTASVYAAKVGGFSGEAIKGRTVYNNSYVTGKITATNDVVNSNASGSGGIVGVKSGGDVQVTNTYYLKDTNRDTFFTTTVTDEKSLHYDELKEIFGTDSSKKESYNYDESLDGQGYPFKMVTSTGASKAECKAHFGDWPSASVSAEYDAGLLYYEIVDGQIYYHGFLSKYVEDDSKITTDTYKEIVTQSNESLENGLVTDSGKYVTEDGYLLVIPKGSNPQNVLVGLGDGKTSVTKKDIINQFTETFDKDRFKKQASRIEQLEDYDLYYFTKSDEDVWDEKESGKYRTFITIGQREIDDTSDKNFGKYSAFSFYPKFADTVFKVGAVGEGYAPDYNTYYVRSARQLAHMYQSPYVKDATIASNITMKQTCDISYVNTSFTNNKKVPSYSYHSVGELRATYNGKNEKANTNYTIQGLSQAFIHSNHGTVEFVTLLDSNIKKTVSYQDSQIGKVEQVTIFAVSNFGTIENVEVRNSKIEQIPSDANRIEVAGFVLYSNGIIRNIQVSNIAITRQASEFAGFVRVNDNVIENVTIDTISMIANSKDGYSTKVAGMTIYNNNQASAIRQVTIKNMTLTSNAKEVAGVVFDSSKQLKTVTMENSHIIANSSSNGSDGKVAGVALTNNDGGIIDSITVTGSKIQSNAKEVAGFVVTNNGTITNSNIKGTSYEQVNIQGSGKVAGFVFNNTWDKGNVRNCFFVGKVTGEDASGFVFTNDELVENCYANVIVTGTNSAMGFADFANWNKTMQNNFVTGKVTSTNGIAYGFARQVGNSNTFSNNYSALFGLSGNERVAFAERAGDYDFNFTNCFYYDATWLGTLKADKEQGSKATYDELSAKGNQPKTHMYDSGEANTDTTQTTYPFAVASGLEFYGNWPKKEEVVQQPSELEGEVGVLYYEIVNGEFYWHGYMADFPKNGEEPVYKEVTNGLLTDSGQYVQEDGYVVVLSNKIKDNIGKSIADTKNGTWGTEDLSTLRKNELLQFNGYEVYYLDNTVDQSNGYITLGPIYNNNIGNVRISLYLQTKFADSISLSKEDNKGYFIRSVRHLQNMNEFNREGMPYEVNQTFDISYDKKDLDVYKYNGIEMDYQYNTPHWVNCKYNVKENSQGFYVIKGLNKTLFSQISPQSELRGITLINSITTGAALVDTNFGTIENCSVRGDGYASVSIKGDIVGGFVNYNSGSIRNSYFEGTVEGRQIGGFVEKNQGTIENCSVRGDSYERVSIKGDTVGGFVNYNSGSIKNSYFEGKVEGRQIGGFVEENQGTIENCSVRGDSYESVSIKGDTVGGFVRYNNKGTIKSSYFVGTIEGNDISGFVEKNESTIENCYTNTIMSATGDASGFVNNNNGGTIKNSFVVGAINSSTGIASGFMKVSSGSMENCYTALFGLSGSKVYLFGSGKGDAYINCGWLDTPWVEGEIQQGDPNDLKAQGVAMSYENMEEKGKLSPEFNTYAFKNHYNGNDTNEGSYPFAVPNGLDFWGNWPKKIETLTSKLGLIYYEIVDGTYYYNGYVSEVNADGTVKEPVTISTQGTENANKLVNGLIEESGKYVSEEGYMILLSKKASDNGISIAYNGGEEIALDSSKQVGEISGLEDYTAYYIDSNQAISNLNQSDKTQMLQIKVTQQLDETASQSFAFQPLYADTVRKIGESIDTFTIRSPRHLLNVIDGISLSDGTTKVFSYEQSADISFIPNKVAYTEQGKPISEQYKFNDSISANAMKYQSKTYTANENGKDVVKGYVIEGLDKNLFTTIGVNSIIQGVTLVDGSGAFVGINYGTIESCAIRPSSASKGYEGIKIKSDYGFLDINEKSGR